MGQLHKFTASEALNANSIGTANSWTVNSRYIWGKDANNDSGDVTTTQHYDVSGNHKIIIDVNTYFYISFATTAEDITTSTAFVIPAVTMFLNIPKGLGNTIYFNALPYYDNENGSSAYGDGWGDPIVNNMLLRVVQL
jgi:hypothetical protein